MGSYSSMIFINLAVTLLILLSLSLLLAAEAKPCNFPAIYSFGDSNSDTGGLPALFGQLPPPYGESFFRGPAGRYSDGRLILDFIAESLGLPYLSSNLDAIGSNFSHGANFATGGATIRLQLNGSSPLSLNYQYNRFSDFRNRTQTVRRKGGVFEQLMPKEEDFSKALYIFDIGQNDLTAGYFANMSTSQVKTYVPDVLTQFSNIVRMVYRLGGRNFWIHNTGPVGCLPYVIYRVPVKAPQVNQYGCASPFNEVAQFFNEALKQAVVQFRQDLPDAAFTFVDLYSLKYALFTHPKKYGFEESIRACCGHGGKYNFNLKLGCGVKLIIHGKEVAATSCEDPSVYVTWDGVHFTQAANEWMFNRIKDGKFSDPPIPLNMACHAHTHAHA